MDIYGEIVLDHFKNPRHAGLLDDATIKAADSNTVCGDSVKISLKIAADGTVENFGFEGEGCAISMASTSLMGEKLIGRRLPDILAMSQQEVLELLAIPISPGRTKCALLGYSCVKKALTLLKQETKQSPDDKI